MRFSPLIYACLLNVWLGVSLLAGADGNVTDYDAEIGRIDEFIRESGAALTEAPPDTEMVLRRVFSLFRRASLTGSATELKSAETAINDAISRVAHSEDLYLLKANLDFKLHRIRETGQDLKQIANAEEVPEVLLLNADVAFQEGRCEEARRDYEAAIQKSRTWDALARLAYFTWKLGDASKADTLYADAEEEITAKEMRAYAWVRLQRGMLELSRGNHDAALAHYQRAQKAYSGYWLADEYMAELLGAQGQFEKAAALYQSIIARAPRPELEQQLGDLYVYMGRPDLAKPWHEQALMGYLDSVKHGEVHYFHHLAAFYADVRENGSEALKWAEKDLALRANFATYDALAWALYRNGNFQESATAMDKALSSGVQDAHLFFHAAMIHLAAGRTMEGKDFLGRAAAVNPLYDRFHVHR
ncbi:tetratricopeptide repeat protein [Verrucomicrobiota bacterium sgz303538]